MFKPDMRAIEQAAAQTMLAAIVAPDSGTGSPPRQIKGST